MELVIKAKKRGEKRLFVSEINFVAISSKLNNRTGRKEEVKGEGRKKREREKEERRKRQRNREREIIYTRAVEPTANGRERNRERERERENRNGKVSFACSFPSF